MLATLSISDSTATSCALAFFGSCLHKTMTHECSAVFLQAANDTDKRLIGEIQLSYTALHALYIREISGPPTGRTMG
jgi:hypothetical protein